MATVQQFINAAESEVGYTETPTGSNRTKFAAEAGHANGQKWCATFVCAIAKRTGVYVPNTASTRAMRNAFEAIGQTGDTPEPGAIAFFDFPNKSTGIEHVGIVKEVHSGGIITTIEGNTSSGSRGSQDNGGGVYLRVRPLNHVVAFGYPTFDYATTAIPKPTKANQVFIIRLCEGNKVVDNTQYVTDFVTRRPIADMWELDSLVARGLTTVDYDHRLAARIPVINA